MNKIIDTLHILLEKHIQNCTKHNLSNGIIRDIDKDFDLKRYIKMVILQKTLIVENTIDYIVDKFNSTSLIVIRPYKDEIGLILGCGNLTNNYPATDEDENKFIDGRLHAHKNMYTLDSRFTLNPSIIGEFPFYNMPVPDNSFEFMALECTYFCTNDINDRSTKEYLRILKDHDVMVIDDIDANLIYEKVTSHVKKLVVIVIKNNHKLWFKSYNSHFSPKCWLPFECYNNDDWIKLQYLCTLPANSDPPIFLNSYVDDMEFNWSIYRKNMCKDNLQSLKWVMQDIIRSFNFNWNQEYRNRIKRICDKMIF